MKLRGILAFVIGAILLLFFGNLLSYYFSQDDFFHLRVVMDKNLSDIPSFFFSLQKEYAFYRPLSREVFYLIMYRVFGLNPLPFHLVNYFLIAGNLVLVFILAGMVVKNRIFSVLSTLVYAASATHSIELYYLASVQTLLATSFLLASVIFYIKFLIIKKPQRYLLSIAFFILALLCHEMSLVLPGIIFFTEFFHIRNKFSPGALKFMVIRLLPFVIIGLLHLFFTSLFSHLPLGQVYSPVFSPKSIFNSLAWYTVWSLGLSEMLIDFVGPRFTINPNLLKWHGSYLKIVLPLLGFILLVIISGVVKFRNKLIRSGIIMFFLSSFVVALSPFLLFPQHKSTFYLSFSTVWFSYILSYPLLFLWNFKKNGRVFVILTVTSFMLVTYQTIQLNKLTYWAAKRAKAAEYLISDFRKRYPVLPKGSIIYVRNDPKYPVIAKEWGTSSKQAFYILSGDDAFKLIYKDLTLKVFFEGINELPENTDHSRVIFYVASFPY